MCMYIYCSECYRLVFIKFSILYKLYTDSQLRDGFLGLWAWWMNHDCCSYASPKLNLLFLLYRWFLKLHSPHTLHYFLLLQFVLLHRLIVSFLLVILE